MKSGSTAKVLPKCKLKYYRISECAECFSFRLQDPSSPDEQFAFQPAARFESTMNTVYDTLSARCGPASQSFLHSFLHTKWLGILRTVAATHKPDETCSLSQDKGWQSQDDHGLGQHLDLGTVFSHEASSPWALCT